MKFKDASNPTASECQDYVVELTTLKNAAGHPDMKAMYEKRIETVSARGNQIKAKTAAQPGWLKKLPTP